MNNNSKTVNKKMRGLRVITRKNTKTIIDHIIKVHWDKQYKICIFCGSKRKLTKEHVIPKWAFLRDTGKFFVDGTNGLSQEYNRATVPCCSSCNNNVLAHFEKYISSTLSAKDFGKNLYAVEELEDIIRWLEIIDYKYHILDLQKKFLTSKESGFIPYLRDFSISMLRSNAEKSPAKVFSELRQSLKRITTKSKIDRINALLTFNTKNKDFHFFHNTNEFIFIELPQTKKAIFYFFEKEFKTEKAAHKQAMKIMQRVYR